MAKAKKQTTFDKGMVEAAERHLKDVRKFAIIKIVIATLLIIMAGAAAFAKAMIGVIILSLLTALILILTYHEHKDAKKVYNDKLEEYKKSKKS